MRRLKTLSLLVGFLAVPLLSRSASFYTQRPADPKAVHFAGSGADDDTAALQQAIDQVHATTGQGIVLVAEARMCASKSLCCRSMLFNPP